MASMQMLNVRAYGGLWLTALVGFGAVACSGATTRGDGRREGSGAEAGGGSGGVGRNGGWDDGGGGDSTAVAPGLGLAKLRLLTRSEYQNALTDLLGATSTPLELPADMSVAGFISIGASHVSVNVAAAEAYEAASRAATDEVFADEARWQKLVGCEPNADLSDDCLITFVKSFGQRAFRRSLTEGEVSQWAQVGRSAARLPVSVAQALAAVTSGLLQSPNFLYRVETNELNAQRQRLAYDGPSMATRLAFLLSGRPPSDELMLLQALDPAPTSPNGQPSDISFRLRKSVLDAVWADAKRLKMSVGSNDAQRLDAHMDAIRSLEERVAATPNGGDPAASADCKEPTEPPATFADMTAKSQALNQLIVTALACNLTRVYTHLWSGPCDDNTYPTIPISGAHHALTHGNQANHNDAAQMERYIMSQYADLAKRMKATKLGAGTLLDSTLMYGVSELAYPGYHIMTNYHVVLMGHAGGKLPGNRHYRAPGRKVTELVLTLQQARGLNVTSWGSWDNTSKTMPEILA